MSHLPNTDLTKNSSHQTTVFKITLFFIPLVIAALFLQLVDRDALWGRYVNALWNTGHLFFPALMTILAHYCFTSFANSNFWHRLIRANLVALLLGLLVERLEGTIDWWDILNNQLGVFIGFAILGFKRSVTIATTAILVLLSAAAVANHALVFNIIDEYRMRHAFPVLVDFEDSLQRSRFYKDDSAEISTRGHIQELTNENDEAAQAMELIIPAALRYEGVELVHLVQNWQNYKTLHLRVMNSELISLPEISIRIQDRQYFSHGKRFDDRYYQDFSLHPEWNRIDIDLEAVRNAPSQREMNMAEIRYLAIYAVAAATPNSLYIDKIWLD